MMDEPIVVKKADESELSVLLDIYIEKAKSLEARGIGGRFNDLWF